MDAESELIKEVFAFYGVAMYKAQCLERQVAISLASVFGPQNITRSEYDEVLAANFNKTMGNLITILLKSAVQIDTTSFEEDLKESLRIRNLLARNYFWLRAAIFIHPEGCRVMIEELQCFANIFDKTDSILTVLTMQWGHEHGVTEHDFEQIFQELAEQGRTVFL